MRTIDLHCHTKATKKGDGKGRNVTPPVFRRKIEDAGVQIVAITNHNVFDHEQYVKLRKAATGIADVWPGVELDIKGTNGKGEDTNHWHMLVILDPNCAQELEAIMDKLTTSDSGYHTSPDECIWPLDEIWDTFRETKSIFISHCHDKKPGITEEDITEIERMAKYESWRFFYEPRKLLTLGIWSNHGRSMLMGSDVKDWSTYETGDFLSLRLDVSSFEQFRLLARRDHTVIDTLLNSRDPQEMHASPHQGIRVTLPIYQDVNVIFGQKGTGKTEIVRSLDAEFQRLGIVTSTYRGGEKYQEYERMLSTDDMGREPSRFGRTDCKQEIGQVMDWTDQLPTFLHEYVDWYETRGNNQKKDAFRIAESQLLPPISDNQEQKAKVDLSIVKDFIDSSRKNKLAAYLDEEDSVALHLLLSKLLDAISRKRIELYIDKKATEMANGSVRAIKDEIDKKSNTVSKPGDTGFLRFALSRIHLGRTVDTIIADLEPAELCDRQYLGTLEDKGTLNLVSRWRYLTKGSVTKEFGGVGIRNLQQWVKAIRKVKEHVFKDRLPESITEFRNTVEDSGIYDLSMFIGTSKYPELDSSNTPYTPSDGEKGIIVLERKLREDASVFLLDEPELGMSNLYIDSVIRPLIEGLAQSRKTVILATHNANLAVRTLPYLSVYREHVQANQYRTYIGNPFRNELVDLDGSAKPLDWSECSITTLEGGYEAFYDRKTIYEAGA